MLAYKSQLPLGFNKIEHDVGWNTYLPIIYPCFWFSMIIVGLEEDDKLQNFLGNLNQNSIDDRFIGDFKFGPLQHSVI